MERPERFCDQFGLEFKTSDDLLSESELALHSNLLEMADKMAGTGGKDFVSTYEGGKLTGKKRILRPKSGKQTRERATWRFDMSDSATVQSLLVGHKRRSAFFSKTTYPLIFLIGSSKVGEELASWQIYDENNPNHSEVAYAICEKLENEVVPESELQK